MRSWVLRSIGLTAVGSSVLTSLLKPHLVQTKVTRLSSFVPLRRSTRRVPQFGQNSIPTPSFRRGTRESWIYVYWKESPVSLRYRPFAFLATRAIGKVESLRWRKGDS